MNVSGKLDLWRTSDRNRVLGTHDAEAMKESSSLVFTVHKVLRLHYFSSGMKPSDPLPEWLVHEEFVLLRNAVSVSFGEIDFDANDFFVIIRCKYMSDESLGACEAIRRRGFDGALILSLEERTGSCEIAALRAGVDEVLGVSVMTELLKEKILLHARKRTLFLNNRDLLSIGRLRLCPDLREVRFGDRSGARITPIEMAILKILSLNAGRLVTRDSLVELVWGCAGCKESRSLDQHVMSLRRKLGFLCEGYAVIQTVRRRGFIFLKRDQEST